MRTRYPAAFGGKLMGSSVWIISPEGAPIFKKSGWESCQTRGNHSFGLNWIDFNSDSSASVKETSKFGSKIGIARRFCISTCNIDWFAGFLRPSRAFSGDSVTEVIFHAEKSLTGRLKHPSALHNFSSICCNIENAPTESEFDVPSTRGAKLGSKEFLDKCSPKMRSKIIKPANRNGLSVFFWADAAKPAAVPVRAWVFWWFCSRVPCKQTQPSLSFQTESVSHWL